MRGRYRHYYLASDYQREVVEKGKCRLDGPEPFQPLFRACDFPSEGFRTTAICWKNDEPVEVMSEGEYQGLLLYEDDPTVTRIATQCALDPEITQHLAREQKTEHPNVDGEDMIMSTDFVLDEERAGVRSRRAISFKREQDITERVLQKAAIESAYWNKLSIPWTMLLDTQLPAVLVRNLQLVHACHDPRQLPCDSQTVALVAAWFTPHLEGGIVAFGTLCRRCDNAIGLPANTALAVALHLIAIRHWPVCMTKPIAGHLVLPIILKNHHKEPFP